MKRILKTFEEYKYIKFDRSNNRTELLPPQGDDPYWKHQCTHCNIKDPDEPFFVRNKWDYFDKLHKKNSNKKETENSKISFDLACEKLKINPSELKNFLDTNGLKISNTYFSNYDNCWVLSATKVYSTYKYLSYFPDEDDYIGEYIDSVTFTRKRFDSPTEYFSWYEHMKNTMDSRRREQSRRTDD